jgi:hypothetical protein
LTGSIPREQQFTGSLIGQCLGDALGFVVEGYPPEACQRYVEEGLKEMGRAGGYPPNLFPFANTRVHPLGSVLQPVLQPG